MTDTSRLEEIADEARQHWSKAIYAYGEYAEWKPTVFVLDGDRLRCGAVLDVEADGEVPGAHLALTLAEKLVTPASTWVAVVVDSYHCADPLVNVLVVNGALPPLSELHRAGWPGVSDALVATACSRDGAFAVVTSCYRRPTPNTVEWQESDTVLDTEDRMIGNLAEGLHALMTRAGN